jgi:hypothetical protein
LASHRRFIVDHVGRKSLLRVAYFSGLLATLVARSDRPSRQKWRPKKES